MTTHDPVIRGKRFLIVAPELIVDILKGFGPPRHAPRYFVVNENPLPKDCRLDSFEVNHYGDQSDLRLNLSSTEWDEGMRELESPCLALYEQPNKVDEHPQ